MMAKIKMNKAYFQEMAKPLKAEFELVKVGFEAIQAERNDLKAKIRALDIQIPDIMIRAEKLESQIKQVEQLEKDAEE